MDDAEQINWYHRDVGVYNFSVKLDDSYNGYYLHKGFEFEDNIRPLVVIYLKKSVWEHKNEPFVFLRYLNNVYF